MEKSSKTMELHAIRVVLLGPDAAALREKLEELGCKILKPKHCLGYPACDGDLPGEQHSVACPVKTPGESWEF